MTSRPEPPRLRSALSPAKQALLHKRLQSALLFPTGIQEIQRRPDRGTAPLSFAQERMWFLEQLQPGNPAHNRPLALRLSGELDLAALEQALSEIVRRHKVLRTTFPAVEGQPVQVSLPPAPVTLPVIDLSDQPSTNRVAEARRRAIEEAGRPIDLVQGPLFRATLLYLDEHDSVLVVVTHHIAFDAWSAGVFRREMAALYAAFSAGLPSPLPEPAIQYADFAAWQRDWLQDEVLEMQLAYWTEQLRGLLPILEIPPNRPKPANPSSKGALQTLILPPTLVRRLQALSLQENATLFMVLLAGFKVLLHRYTGTPDIVTGSPIAGRTRTGTEALIGLFINTLVLRIDLSGQPSFRQILARVRDVALGAYEHQELPIEKLVEVLNPERSLGQTPLFQVLFNFENIPGEDAPAQSLQFEPFEFERGIAQFDLSLELVETAGGLSCLWKYRTDLYDDATITRMVESYQTLLEGIAANPDELIGRLPILTAAEQHQVLVAWNDTAHDYAASTLVHELIEAQVNQSPDCVAVSYKDLQLTYRELDQKANQLAHYLQSLGVGPEVRVGVCLERSAEMIVSLLGILKAGGVYVPLDPGYPVDRLAYMIQEAQPAVLLTKERSAVELPASASQITYLDTDRLTIELHSSSTPRSNVGPENLAYIIFTSGSTGKPKGVMVPHRALCNRLLWTQRVCPLTTADRVLARAAFAFDGSLRELLWPLTSGAQIVMAQTGQNRDASALAQLICEKQISHAYLSVSLLSVLLEDRNVDGCRSLRGITSGGEALLPELVERIVDRLHVPVFNTYGPSEAPTATTWRSDVEGNCSGVLLGRPATNVQVYLLDQSQQPVPVGVPGELYVGGTALGRGYLDRPRDTAERFLPNPFAAEPGMRLYRTGDLARYLPDGNLEFLGRIDSQVKIRGYRVEPGEIESVLNQHPEVQSSAVVAQGDSTDSSLPHLSMGTRLVAYYVSRVTPGSTATDLRAFLQVELPDYMIPSAFVSLKAFPLTSSGKVDRRALPAVELSRPDLKQDYVAPRTDIEQTLANIWTQVLEIERVGIHDDFFEMGGHSLLATRVTALASNAFNLQVSLRSLFDAPTIAGLATSIEIAQWAAMRPQHGEPGAGEEREEFEL